MCVCILYIYIDYYCSFILCCVVWVVINFKVILLLVVFALFEMFALFCTLNKKKIKDIKYIFAQQFGHICIDDHTI